MLFAFEIALFLFLMPLIIAVIGYCGVAILYALAIILGAIFAPTVIGFLALVKSKDQYEEYCSRQKIRKENGTYKKIYWYYPGCFVGGGIMFSIGIIYAVWLISYVNAHYFN